MMSKCKMCGREFHHGAWDTLGCCSVGCEIDWRNGDQTLSERVEKADTNPSIVLGRE